MWLFPCCCSLAATLGMAPRRSSNDKAFSLPKFGCGCSLCALWRIGVLSVASKATSSAMRRSMWAQQTWQRPHPAPGQAWPPVHGIGATMPPCRRSANRSIDSESELSAVQYHYAMWDDVAFLPRHFGRCLRTEIMEPGGEMHFTCAVHAPSFHRVVDTQACRVSDEPWCTEAHP